MIDAWHLESTGGGSIPNWCRAHIPSPVYGVGITLGHFEGINPRDTETFENLKRAPRRLAVMLWVAQESYRQFGKSRGMYRLKHLLDDRYILVQP